MTKNVPIRRHFSFEEHPQLFILEKKAQGISQQTEKDYWYMVSFFFRKYPDALISQKKLKNCVLQFFSQEVAPATFNIRRKYLKAFFDYLVREEVIEENPINFPVRKE